MTHVRGQISDNQKLDVMVVSTALIEWRQLHADGSTKQRFGQWYVNKHMPRNTVWPEVFYETDPDIAWRLIVEDILYGLPVERKGDLDETDESPGASGRAT